MIIFYDIETGYCVRSSQGIASDVTIENNIAYLNGEVHWKDMTNIAIDDIIDQNIYNYDSDGLLTPKLFSELKQGILDEVRIKAMEDALLAIMGV